MKRLVVNAAKNLAAGRAVMAIPDEVTLTPAEAAELLGLSRPFVARLLEQGDIPSELLPGSRHHRIRLEDVLAFQWSSGRTFAGHLDAMFAVIQSTQHPLRCPSSSRDT